MIELLFERMEAHGDAAAIVSPHAACSHRHLLSRARAWGQRTAALPPGSIVSIEGDYGAELIAAFLALAAGGHVIVPLSPDSGAQHASFRELADVEYRIRLDHARPPPAAAEPGLESDVEPDIEPDIERTDRSANHSLYGELRQRRHPGLILFSSGSTGKPKAALHDLWRLLAKYKRRGQRYRTLVFLLLDHIGGVNTLFYTLSNGGTVVV